MDGKLIIIFLFFLFSSALSLVAVFLNTKFMSLFCVDLGE